MSLGWTNAKAEERNNELSILVGASGANGEARNPCLEFSGIGTANTCFSISENIWVSSAPQTEQEMEAFFFNLIGRRKGDNANDFSEVLNREYTWNGQRMKIPHNIPGPGERLPSNAPFYGLTRQTDPSGNTSKARVWIPAAIPDIDENGNQWFTRYYQIIEDTPGGRHGIDFTWSWTYKGGHDYVPLTGPEVPPVIPPVESPPTNDAVIEALNRQIELLLQIIEQLNQQTTKLVEGLATIRAEVGRGIRVRFQ